MIETVVNWLKDLSPEATVTIVAMLPISELRGAIPLGLFLGLSLPKAFFFAVLGNCLMVAPVLFLLEPVSSYLRRFKLFAKFFNWFFERTKKNAETVQKYEALGLLFFVGIPLPITGAWTGAVAATLFKIRFRYAFLAIILGIFMAGLIVSLLCTLGMLSFKAATM